MPIDIRINEVQTEIYVMDASALLTPQVREMIVRDVLKALEDRLKNQHDRESERSLGSQRERERGT